MRENRTCGSEGGEAQSLPYPYPVSPYLLFPLSLPSLSPYLLFPPFLPLTFPPSTTRRSQFPLTFSFPLSFSFSLAFPFPLTFPPTTSRRSRHPFPLGYPPSTSRRSQPRPSIVAL